MNDLDTRDAEIARLRSDLAAALERERMALWALDLEGLRHPPAGWVRRDWGLRHLASSRGLSRGGGVTWLLDSDHVGYRTALAAILSIDPEARPPDGWAP